jgi:hypothetical protein
MGIVFQKNSCGKTKKIHTVPVRMKPNAATIAFVSVFIANVLSARADEKLSSLQTSLSSTTFSGYVSAEISIPPPPDLQIQFNQAEIQPAPEPSTITLGSLAIGLIALARLNKRQRFFER